MRRFAEFRPRKSEEGKKQIGTWGNHNQSIAIMAVTTDIHAHVRLKQGGNHNQSIAIMAVTTAIIAQVHIEMRNLVVTQIIAHSRFSQVLNFCCDPSFVQWLQLSVVNAWRPPKQNGSGP